MAQSTKNANRKARHARVRKKISGTAQRPRLNVYKSNTNMYAQIIDDVEGRTLVSASTLDDAVETKGSTVESAKAVGQVIAKKALEQGIENVVFDRSGYIYHGKVKAIAEGAREAGLKL
ncbi:MAG: 50S ribosomal protein L18 [Peptoniphilaceae bacterium]|nr:50S ribosomal protein L18 [Peptoniphilaceae bacterium]MDY6085206.1 50S ribosomal protein L18 [Peptoniphilaceae bacterium]